MKVRKTMTTMAVLNVLADGAGEDLHGLEICKRAHLGSSTAYGILSRLERAGMIAGRWEDETAWQNPEDGKRRPRRRYYDITGAGRLFLQDAAQPSRTSTLRPGLAK